MDVQIYRTPTSDDQLMDRCMVINRGIRLLMAMQRELISTGVLI